MDHEQVLYTTLRCAGCAGDMLVSVDPATGAVIDEIACLEDPFTHEPLSDVTGLTWACGCVLYIGFSDSDIAYHVDPRSGAAFPVSPNDFSGTFGFASISALGRCLGPPTCDATADPPGCSSVRLHANASDPQGDPLTYAWTTTCAGASFSPSASDANPTVSVDSGCRTCTFEVIIDDGDGGTCSDSVDVAFADSTPPVLAASALVACLWPPSHALVDIGLAVEATDDCAAPDDVTVTVTSVTTDEMTGSERGAGGRAHCPDAVVDGLSVKLRAERSGGADGRVYRITLQAADPCGNASEAVVEVRVPHDHRARSRRGPCEARDGGALVDATRCD